MKNNTIEIALTGNSEAANLRVSGHDGSLVAVGLPTTVSGMALKPVCAVGKFVVASAGGRLYAIDREASDSEATLIADMGDDCAIYCGVAGGEKAIVMTSAGAMHIVAVGEEVVCRGTLPVLPEVEVALVEVATLSETVPAVSVVDAESMRGGALSARDSAAVAAALDSAWMRIKSRTAMLGASIIPAGTTITAEIRQLDEGGNAVATRGRSSVGSEVSVDEIHAPIEGSVIGPMELSVAVVKVRITMESLDAENLALWGAGSVRAQIALSAAPAVDANWTMRVERPSSGEARLSVIPHLVGAPAGIDAALQAVATVPAGDAVDMLAQIPVRVTEAIGETAVGAGFIARTGAVSGDVVLWGCLDGAPGDVAMAPACSPLALMARTTVSLSAVAALEAAPRLGSVALSPGCAHFYAFTADGILNISVGARRGAPAASLLDRRGVGHPRQVAVFPEYVVALTDSGDTLIQLRGGGASTLFRTLGDRFSAIAPEPSSGELYLLDNEGAVSALDLARQWLTRRPLPYAVGSMSAIGDSLYLTSANAMADASAPDSAQAVAISLRAPLPLGTKPSAVERMRVGIDAHGEFDGEVSLWPVGFPDTPHLLSSPMWRAAITGTPRSPIAFRLPLPVRAASVVELSGMATPGTRITDITVETRPLTPGSYGW